MSSARVTRRKVRVEPPLVPGERPGPEGGVRDRRRRERAAALATAALRLFLERGIEAVTIDEIAARAGVAKGSFYTYFPDKTALVDALLEPVRAPLVEALDRCDRALEDAADGAALADAYLSLAAGCASAVLAHPGVALLYLQESRGPAVGARAPVAALAKTIRERAEALTATAWRHGMLERVDPRVSATAVVGAAEAMVFRALSGDELGAPAEVAAALIELMLNGVASRRAASFSRASSG